MREKVDNVQDYVDNIQGTYLDKMKARFKFKNNSVLKKRTKNSHSLDACIVRTGSFESYFGVGELNRLSRPN